MGSGRRCVTLRDEPNLPRRAVDQQGSDLMSLQPGSFSNRCLPHVPKGRARSWPTNCAAIRRKAEIPEMANFEHIFVKARARVNNQSEDSHQAAHERERERSPSGSPNSRRRCCRAQARSGSTSRSSDGYYATRSIASTSAHRFAARHGFMELT